MAYDLLAWKAWAANATTDEIAEMLVQKSEAVRVLAIAADTPMAWKLRTCPECQKIRQDIENNPIAAEAVRKAGG